ncbi:hypothetical protein B0T16DRAFT_460408 [Cercophora newfieldiana]|uniref:Heterokaryon incompatibility domain-containing protein n=1 Tax=Cercophora newfieldiana TaxID=92897 RepID=A0AA40CPA9_9PEZI|nr:hypothetical protein B0T16DRAFT_460408 [Cercophora newfieldiana]
MQTFRYSPLADPNEIRLLKLLPGGFDDEIQLRISHHELHVPQKQQSTKWAVKQLLDTLPPEWEVHETYEGRYLFLRTSDNSRNVLEESWEHPDPAIPRHMCHEQYTDNFQPRPDENDTGPWLKLECRESLIIALRHLRSAQYPRTLWIDAICINQADEAERVRQVRRMGMIYTLAALSSGLGPLHMSRRDEFFCILDNGHLVLDDETWSTIKELLSRSWFQRLWRLQEIQLANPRDSLMQLGHHAIKVSHWCRVIFFLLISRDILPPERFLAVSSAARMATPVAGAGCSTVLDTSLRKKCSDPRNHIYGILGLASPGLASSISPNYAASWTAADAFKDAIPQQDRATLVWEFAHDLYAAGFSSAEWAFEAPGVLRVTGAACAVVSGACTPVLPTASDDEGVTIIRSWEPDGINTLPYLPARAGASASRRRAHLINLSMGMYADHAPMRAELPSLQQLDDECVEAGLYLPKPSSAPPRPEQTDTPYGANIYDILRHCSNRRYIHTHEGYMGIAPAHTEVGDIIAVFLGCENPVVLRPVADGHFRFVGLAYIHGLENANGLLGPLPHPWAVQQKRVYGDLILYEFVNTETGAVTVHDPRLGDLGDWVHTPADLRVPDSGVPRIYNGTFARGTEVMNSDLRMLPEALRARGVPLRTFSLV